MGAANLPLILKLGHNICICSGRLFEIFILVFGPHDFELGRNVSCEESAISPAWGLFILVYFLRCHLEAD